MGKPAKQAKVPFSKIIGSKWTAANPTNGEKHFLVTRIADHKRRELKLECVVTRRSFILPLSELTNAANYTSGWH
ncbi:TIGR02450 family Trp-rich protein [Turneriella parva]|uniref:TIGR02450 family Trp-rich protein n=1 Tax=Turneriella parva (strain ATCC BAA-1111 / DSM 21527 / NCTC 11395 / H) TaxID=869212 RepID=I4B2K8_TURPD|nr:TIGR02450 family Trp-rich protein [Turneriella parva]AFM11515.1 hypothetical protein Turpa_0864 [Turneriella parva DSM 21527]